MNGSESCFKNNHPLDLGVKMNENEVFAPEMATGRKKKRVSVSTTGFCVLNPWPVSEILA